MNIKNIIYYDYLEIKSLYKIELPSLFSLIANSNSYSDFSTGLQTLIKEKDYLDSKYRSLISELISYNSKSIYELSSQEKIKIETLSYLYNFIKNEDIDRSVSKDLYIDLYFLFLPLENKLINKGKPLEFDKFINRWDSGLDENIQDKRGENKKRIINLLIEKIEKRKDLSSKYQFEDSLSHNEKYIKVEKWWENYRFHLSMAIKSPNELNKFLGFSLSKEIMDTLSLAKKKNMPFFYTPYYLSLICVDNSFDDYSLRSYVLYSSELIETYGNIKAWEREDIIEEGKPNAAGWLLPEGGNIHRRYPEVAILIPDTRGRACGGLCASCQRMYDFQSSRLNFNLSSLAPKESWDKKLHTLMNYFENDTQIRDILLTGGDALMSKNKTLKNILDSIYRMAKRKHLANINREDGEKYAEIKKVRLGSRLLAYLPMRIDDELIEILKEFREKSLKIGIEQFVIQTHFQTPLEITPKAKKSIEKILSIGWRITNQLVYNVAVSRKGHNIKLRQELNSLGVLPYYTFSVKGFKENYAVYSPISRSSQEKNEEKILGQISQEKSIQLLKSLRGKPNIKEILNDFLNKENIPFLASDRNVLNIPAIGKSMTFRLIGISKYGQRILEFKHDSTRNHSPIIDDIKHVYIRENKSIAEYLRQLDSLKEDISQYSSIWYYTEEETEKCFGVFQYPEYNFNTTKRISNFQEIMPN